MAQLGMAFDANTVDPNGGFTVVPPGKYAAQIIGSDMRPTKDGRGSYLYLELEICDGPEHGKRLFERLNLNNPNQTAVDIARRTLSQICHAVGIMTVTNSEQLHARRMIADVRVEKGTGSYSDQNKIVSYSPFGGVVTAGQVSTEYVQAAPNSAPAMASAMRGASPPWRTQVGGGAQ